MIAYERILNRISLKPEYIFFILPFFLITGDWLLSSVFILFLFLFFLKDKIFLDYHGFVFYNAVNWVLLLLWGIYIISKTPKIGAGVYYYFGVILTPFFIFMLVQNLNLKPKHIYYFLNCLFISGIILSIFSFYNSYLTGFDFKLRVGSIWDSTNILAAYYLVLFMFCLSFILNRINPKAIILYITTLVFLFFAIFLTNTRAIWIALLFSLLVFFVKKPRIIIVSSVLIGLFMFLFSDIILSRFLTIKYFGSDLSSLGRLQAWIATTALLKNNLLTGYWFDAFMDLRDNVYTIYLVPVIHSHNTYLRSLLEMGLIGSVLYYSFFFRALYFSIKLRNSENSNTVNGLLDGIQLSIISLLIVFIFEPYLSLFGCSTIIIWLIISFTFKLKYYINAERELNNISC